jgi:YYY domain-containing protein
MATPAGDFLLKAAAFLKAKGHLLVLLGLLALAFYLRLYGINWANGGHFHPDERAIVEFSRRIAFPTDEPSLLFDAKSPLNPGWFNYGSLPLYLIRFVSYVAPPDWFGEATYDQVFIAGRAISAVFDVLGILVLYLIGARLFGKWAGVLAAALITFSVLHIGYSHFLATDIMLAALLVVTFSFLVKASQEGKLRHFAFAGIFFGLTMSTKVSAAPFAIGFVGAAWLWASAQWSDRAQQGRTLTRALGLFIAAMAIAAAVFIVTQPYGVIDYKKFAADVSEQGEMVRRIRDYPYTRQYVDTPAYLYQIKQLVVWGMGIPAGLLMMAGFAFSFLAAVWKRRPVHILLVAWVLPYFIINGAFDVKFMRYMLPVTPFLALMASAFAAWLVRHARMRAWRRIAPRAVYAALALIMAFTVFYAFAYSRIYSKPHPAEATSQWILKNVPKGSTLAREHWEEGLRFLGEYRHTEMELYNEPENTFKRNQIIDRLTQADYLIFYSNRLYGTIPRLEERYPLTTAYYHLLFGGKLGYELVHWEASYPTLFGVAFKDDTFRRPGLPVPEPLRDYKPASLTLNLGFADESYSVYDHPLVLVFKKTVTGAPAAQRAFFDAMLPPASVSGPEPPAGPLLTKAEVKAQQEGGTWSDLFDRDGWVNTVPAVVFYLVIQLMALLTAPIAFVVFRGLPDKGYFLAKMLGLLLVGYFAWLLASLHWLAFTRLSIGLGIFVLALASFQVSRWKRDELRAFWRENKRLILTGELLFLVAFAAAFAVRIWNPDLWHPYRGGEKPMDFAYFNAVVRSSFMPPYDPWYSGGYLNYYYFGQFLAAVPTKFTGVVPSIAINVAIPLFFALTAVGVFSVAYNLATLTKRRLSIPMPSPVKAGLLAVLLVLIASNLDGIVQVAQGVGRVVNDRPFGTFDFWRSSRLMPPDPPGFEINEFPFFTFLFADPHAHLFVMPLTLAALGLAMAFLLQARKMARVGAMAVLPYTGLALLLGAIQAANSWDVPTYLLIIGLTLITAEYIARREAWGEKTSAARVADLGATLLLAVGKTIGVYVLSAIIWRPFHSRYETFLPITDSVQSSEAKTALWQYLEIHGLFIVVLLGFLAYRLWRERESKGLGGLGIVRAWRAEAKAADGTVSEAMLVGANPWAIYTLAVAGIFFGLWATDYTTVGFMVVMLSLLVPLLLRAVKLPGEEAKMELFILALLAMPFILGGAVDIFNINLPLGRMNTVFKLYLQAWILLGILTAYALWRIGFGGVFSRRWLRAGTRVFIVLALLAVLVYPVTGTQVRARDRFNTGISPTADGMAYMDTAVYNDGAPNRIRDMRIDLDKSGIQWLQDHVKGSPVIVEGNTDLYRWGSRISIYTGLPAVIGWDWHQKQQRWGFQPSVDVRRRDVAQFYNTASPAEAEAFLDTYGVRYIYVGQLEQAFYAPQGIAKFEQMEGKRLALRYQNGGVKIYEVLPKA